MLFGVDEIKAIWNTRLEIKHLVIAGAVLSAAVIIFVRSGNGAADWMTPEQGFRQLLENSLFVRPRTKEFLLGHPLLLLGFYFKNPWLILAGMIGQVSIINTFMHAHSPLIISLARTLYGMLFGTAIGIAIIEAYKFVKKRKAQQ
jgi:hypothetical protein